MQKLVQIGQKTHKVVHDVMRIPEELRKLAEEKQAEGYEVSRGALGTVVLSFPDGEIQFVPAGNKIVEHAFRYEQ